MKIRYIIILVLGVILYTMLLTGVSRVVFSKADKGKEQFGAVISGIIFESSEVPRKINSFFSEPRFFISNDSLKDGFTYFSEDIASYPKLLISFKEKPFVSKFQLLDIRTGKLIKEWNPDSKLISRLSYNEANPDSHEKGSDLNLEHPVLLKDSSVIFNTGYSLIKMDANSKIEWVNNSIIAHHSIELDGNGDIYISGRNFKSGHYNFLPKNPEEYEETLKDDVIMKVDHSSGEVLYSKHVLEILQQNDYESLIYDRGYFINDPVHLNDVQPALNDAEFWNKGDLLISCRNISAIFLYRPSTNKILWLRQGPWLAQHDPDFLENDKITVFGNDVIYDYSWKDRVLQTSYHFLSGNNEIYVYDLQKDTVLTPFNRLLKNENVTTPSQGLCQILPNGDIFIEETDHGRIIFGDSILKKIEFVRRVDPEHITTLNWSRIVY